MTEKAVVDRFEGELAIVLIDGKRHHIEIPLEQLPPGIREGDHLQIERHDDQIIYIQSDDEATDEARQRIAEKLDRLRRGDHLKDEDA